MLMEVVNSFVMVLVGDEHAGARQVTLWRVTGHLVLLKVFNLNFLKRYIKV